tara:strand:- start:79 stop:387 length:309 start_codon:yes stop_codon:yes gene_type:complete
LATIILVEKNIYKKEIIMNTFTQDELWEAIQTLGWDVRTDDISLEIAGTQVYEIEGDGTRWKPVKGTRKYNKDAFIVIKNRSRNPYVPSLTTEQQKVNDEVK